MIEIRETRDIQDVLQCVPYECQIREKGRDKVPLKEMLYLTAQWFASDPYFHFFMFYEDGKLIAYVALRVIIDKHEGGIFVIRGYREPDKPEVMEKFYELAKQIGKAYKVDRLMIKTENEKIRNHFADNGFSELYTVMERRL